MDGDRTTAGSEGIVERLRKQGGAGVVLAHLAADEIERLQALAGDHYELVLQAQGEIERLQAEVQFAVAELTRCGELIPQLMAVVEAARRVDEWENDQANLMHPEEAVKIYDALSDALAALDGRPDQAPGSGSPVLPTPDTGKQPESLHGRSEQAPQPEGIGKPRSSGPPYNDQGIPM